MKPLQILIPMGGLGQRFRDAGFTTPKPLIEVEGVPMFLHALASFDAYNGEKEYIFVVRQDAEDEQGLATSIRTILPHAKITMLHENTRGAAETALLARDFINNDNPLVIMDCDFRFTSVDYFEKVQHIVERNAYDGILLSFESSLDRYSYARVDNDDRVLETAEKRVISNHALAGAYCFASGRLFVDAAESLLKKPLGPDMKEYYISYVYNELVKDNKYITLAHGNFYSFGTPEELEQYIQSRA